MAKPKKPVTDAPSAPFHAGLAGLSSLRDELPAGTSTKAGDIGAAPAAKPDPMTQPPARVVLQIERAGRGGKTVTRVRGFGERPDVLECWAKRMKQSLGCGGSVDGQDILLTGDLMDRAQAWLTKLGVPKIVRGS